MVPDTSFSGVNQLRKLLWLCGSIFKLIEPFYGHQEPPRPPSQEMESWRTGWFLTLILVV